MTDIARHMRRVLSQRLRVARTTCLTRFAHLAHGAASRRPESDGRCPLLELKREAAHAAVPQVAEDGRRRIHGGNARLQVQPVTHRTIEVLAAACSGDLAVGWPEAKRTCATHKG